MHFWNVMAWPVEKPAAGWVVRQLEAVIINDFNGGNKAELVLSRADGRCVEVFTMDNREPVEFQTSELRISVVDPAGVQLSLIITPGWTNEFSEEFVEMRADGSEHARSGSAPTLVARSAE